MKIAKSLPYIFAIVLICSCESKELKKSVFRPNGEIGKDVVISEGYPKNNYSKLDKLHMLSLSIQDTIDNDSRFMLRFGFASLPEMASIDSAFIYLYAIDPGHFGEGNDFLVERIANLWVNSEATWENQPTSDSSSVLEIQAPKDKLEDYKIDVTEFVRGVQKKTHPNYGHIFKLKSEEKPHKGIRFCSSDHKDESKRPKLEVYYQE